jgi:hypothetical protein
MTNGDQVWIGHNRYKTTGAVNRANAHPFEVLDENGDVLLVGAHNGTLDNKFEIERQTKDKYDTDSEALFNLMVEKPNVKAAIGELRGAWSLVWWDATTDTLNFLRNKERPMTYAYTKDRKAIVWASEPWMIINACRRNGVELEQNEKNLSCYATNTDVLYSMQIPEKADAELPDLTREGGYLGAPSRTFQGYGSRVADGFRSWWDELDDDPNGPFESDKEAKEKAAASKKETEADGKKDGTNVVTLGHPPLAAQCRGYEGKAITIAEVNKLKAGGCRWCGGPIRPIDPCAFIGPEEVVCTKCVQDKHPKGGFVDPNSDEEPFPGDYERLIDAAVTGRTAKATSEKNRAVMDTVKKTVG